MVVDMSTEKHQKNRSTATTLQHTTMDTELISFAKKKKKTSQNGQQTYQLHLDHMKGAVNPTYKEQRTNNFDQPGVTGTCHQIHREHGRLSGDVRRSTKYAKCSHLNETNVQLGQSCAEPHIDQIFKGRKCSGRDGAKLEPRQFSDALENLKSKRRLFPQSLEFVQRDRETVKLVLDTNLSEHGIRSPNNSEMSECSTSINKQTEGNLKKFKDKYPNSSYGSTGRQPSRKIVVLRSAPKVMETPEHITCSCSSLHPHQPFRSKGQNATNTHFFKEIKKRWKLAIGQNQGKQHWFSSIVSFQKIPPRKWFSIEAGDKQSRFSTRKASNSSAHITKRDKSIEKRDSQLRNAPEISTTDETVCRIWKQSTGSYSKHCESDIFQEEKKHLSERLRNVNRSEILENRQSLRTLERILRSPEYDSYSPLSPQWNTKHGSVSAERTFSPRFSVKEDHSSESDDKVTQLMPILDFSVHTTHATEGTSASEDDSKTLGSNEIGKEEDLSTFEVSPEPLNTGFTCARHKAETNRDGDGFNSSMLDSPSYDQIIKSSFDVSPSSPISPQEMVDNIKDGEEHQSPVSVLEPLLLDDAGSPKIFIIQSSAGQLEPLRIDYEDYSTMSPRDPKIKSVDFTVEDKVISAYMKAVLQVAGLNWDAPLLSRPSPDQVLHTSFSHEEKLSQTSSHHDPKLLFDCVSDVLLEVYARFFGCSPWISYLKPNYIAFPLEDHLVNEAVKDVKCLLLPQTAEPTLDQLVGHDFAKSTSWLNVRLETEELGNQIAEDILEDSVEDAILELYSVRMY